MLTVADRPIWISYKLQRRQRITVRVGRDGIDTLH